MLSILCVRLTIKVKVGIPESFKVGWYPPKKTGSSHPNAGGNCMQLYGNVKKQFVAQSVICIEKLTTAMENELFKTNKHQFCFPC